MGSTAPEFSRLVTAVSAHLDNKPEKLKDATERGNRRDFSYLASTTGWDAACGTCRGHDTVTVGCLVRVVQGAHAGVGSDKEPVNVT